MLVYHINVYFRNKAYIAGYESMTEGSRKIRRKHFCRRKIRLRNFCLRKLRRIGNFASRQFRRKKEKLVPW